MAQLPQEQKAKIAEQVASFQEEKSKLDAEVSKWDDSGNDIIVLAKQMCMIMMEMTDFTRWGYLLPAPFCLQSNPWQSSAKSQLKSFTFLFRHTNFSSASFSCRANLYVYVVLS